MTMRERALERQRSFLASDFRNLEHDRPLEATTFRRFGTVALTAPLSPVAYTRLKHVMSAKDIRGAEY